MGERNDYFRAPRTLFVAPRAVKDLDCTRAENLRRTRTGWRRELDSKCWATRSPLPSHLNCQLVPRSWSRTARTAALERNLANRRADAFPNFRYSSIT